MQQKVLFSATECLNSSAAVFWTIFHHCISISRHFAASLGCFMLASRYLAMVGQIARSTIVEAKHRRNKFWAVDMPVTDIPCLSTIEGVACILFVFHSVIHMRDWMSLIWWKKELLNNEFAKGKKKRKSYIVHVNINYFSFYSRQI